MERFGRQLTGDKKGFFSYFKGALTVHIHEGQAVGGGVEKAVVGASTFIYFILI